MPEPKRQDYLELFKRIVIYIVMAMIAVLIVAVVYTMGVLLYDMMSDPNFIFTDKAEVLSIIGYFLLAVIALEILDILNLYTKTHVIHVEVVMLVALTSVARELIVFNYDNNDGVLIAGIGLLVGALAVAYYFIKKAHHDYGVSENGSG